MENIEKGKNFILFENIEIEVREVSAPKKIKTGADKILNMKSRYLKVLGARVEIYPVDGERYKDVKLQVEEVDPTEIAMEYNLQHGIETQVQPETAQEEVKEPVVSEISKPEVEERKPYSVNRINYQQPPYPFQGSPSREVVPESAARRPYSFEEPVKVEEPKVRQPYSFEVPTNKEDTSIKEEIVEQNETIVAGENAAKAIGEDAARIDRREEFRKMQYNVPDNTAKGIVLEEGLLKLDDIHDKKQEIGANIEKCDESLRKIEIEQKGNELGIRDLDDVLSWTQTMPKIEMDANGNYFVTEDERFAYEELNNAIVKLQQCRDIRGKKAEGLSADKNNLEIKRADEQTRLIDAKALEGKTYDDIDKKLKVAEEADKLVEQLSLSIELPKKATRANAFDRMREAEERTR